MKRVFFAYIRVSTQKQGEKGVSLQEQRSAIEGYAQRNNLEITRWFEERQTAAKSGRPLFVQMLKLLRRGKANGILIHKIDRSARNLKDWADLGSLIDQGVDVHFVNESLDLQSRGGRLSADIQAVVAADFIRNLKEESRKGVYGRLKQGLLPLPAPLGYLDTGRGKPKIPDPDRADLMRTAFKLYATGQFNLRSLARKMYDLGLRNRVNKIVSKNALSRHLNNPFFAGIIRLKTGETFEGIHQPLINMELFQQVQNVLQGRSNTMPIRHQFQFRRLLTCSLCQTRLIGETQKGHIYYRCHTSGCQTKCLREEDIDNEFRRLIQSLAISQDEEELVDYKISQLKSDSEKSRITHLKTCKMTIQAIHQRLLNLTDAYVDGLLDKEAYFERREAFLSEKKSQEIRLNELELGYFSFSDALRKFFKFCNTVAKQYDLVSLEDKRAILKIVTSNRNIRQKNLEFTLSIPFSLIGMRKGGSSDRIPNLEPRKIPPILAQSDQQHQKTTLSSPSRAIPRTWTGIFSDLVKFVSDKETMLPIWEYFNESGNKND